MKGALLKLWRNLREMDRGALAFCFSAVLLFAHLFFSETRTAWYVREISRDISLLLMALFAFLKIKNRFMIYGFLFFAVKLLFSITDGVLGFFGTHIHGKILQAQYFPLGFIILMAFCEWKNGRHNNN